MLFPKNQPKFPHRHRWPLALQVPHSPSHSNLGQCQDTASKFLGQCQHTDWIRLCSPILGQPRHLLGTGGGGREWRQHPALATAKECLHSLDLSTYVRFFPPEKSPEAKFRADASQRSGIQPQARQTGAATSRSRGLNADGEPVYRLTTKGRRAAVHP
jgi:hypothetical protein